MKRMVIALAALAVLTLSTGAARASEPELVDDISGVNLAMIQIAWGEYDRKMSHDPIEAYKIYVYRQDQTITVIFRDADWSTSWRGGSQFEVEIGGSDNQVIRSEFKSWR